MASYFKYRTLQTVQTINQTCTQNLVNSSKEICVLHIFLCAVVMCYIVCTCRLWVVVLWQK